jgi:hypothetical protein
VLGAVTYIIISEQLTEKDIMIDAGVGKFNFQQFCS